MSDFKVERYRCGLKPLHFSSLLFAWNLPAVNKTANAMKMVDTAMTAGAKVGGSTKLDVTP